MTNYLRIAAAVSFLTLLSGARGGCGHRDDHDDHHDEEQDHHSHSPPKHDPPRHHPGPKPTIVKPTTPPVDRSRIGSFVLLAQESIAIDKGVNVSGGDVGVRTERNNFYEIEIDADSRVGIDARLIADSIEMDRRATAGVLYVNELRASGATYGDIFTFVPPPELPLMDSAVPGAQSISVRPNHPITLPPGAYRDIRVRERATLELAGGEYDFRSLTLDEDSKLVTLDTATVRVLERLEVGKRASLAPTTGLTAADLRLDVKGYLACSGHGHHCCHGRWWDDDDDWGDDYRDRYRDHDNRDSAIAISRDASIRALLVSPDETVELDDRVTFVGAIAAERIEIDDDATVTFEDGFGCRPTSCASIGVSCGVYPDGCGGIMNCGSCTEPQTSCYGFDLLASNTVEPDISYDAVMMSEDTIQIAIPSKIDPTEGRTVVSGSVVVSFEELSVVVDCYYSPTPTTYAFSACSNGAQAGEVISANGFQLHVEATIATTVSLRLNAQPCNCVAATCQTLSASCGVVTDGCGGLLACGQCAAGQTCGGDPNEPLACGCAAKTCFDLGAECGSVDDGCGGEIDCGECSEPDTCGAISENTCGCVARTCSDAGATCGAIDDGCGSLLDCGSCDSPNSCGGGGAQNTCGCRRATCADFGRSCGVMTDGCGGLVDCGGCGASRICDIPSGECLIPEVFANASLPGAELDVEPGSAAPNQLFSVGEDFSIPKGSLQRAVDGPVITVGTAVHFTANGAASYSFASTERCTTLRVPYDRDLVNGLSLASAQTLTAYLVTYTNKGPLLVPVPESQLIDSGGGTITWCTTHLSTYVIAAKAYCAVTITSLPIAVSGGVQSPSNAAWTIGEPVSFDPTTFGAPPSIELSASSDANACMGALLFFGAGTLSHVCYYDNVQASEDVCLYPYDRRTTACSNISGDGGLYKRNCFKLLFETEQAISARLGRPPALAGTIGGAQVWVDPRDPVPAVIADVTDYHVSTWLVPGFQVSADVSSITSSLFVESHPHICAQSGSEGGLVGQPCGLINDGCGSQISCGVCATGLICQAGSCACPASGCPNTVEYCGSNPTPIDKSNPCRGHSCNVATGSIEYFFVADGTPCADNDGCNGIERCFGGTCNSGVPVLVSDGDACTLDTCAPGASGPTHSLNGSLAECATPTQCFVPPDSHVLSTKSALQAAHDIQATTALDEIKNACADCALVLP